MPLTGRESDEPGTRELAELAALADGSLAPERRAALEARVAAEPELAALLAEQERAVGMARSAADEVGAPAALRARIAAQRPSPRHHRARRRLLVAAVAVPVILAIAVGVQLTAGTSGETLHAALAPTALDPGVTGDATFTKTASGWRIQLAATGLPRREGTLFYQAWLRNRAGVLVPIGTFNEGTNVTLWAGVSPKDYPVLTVTREQADGNQASSGDKVLVGTAG